MVVRSVIFVHAFVSAFDDLGLRRAVLAAIGAKS